MRVTEPIRNLQETNDQNANTRIVKFMIWLKYLIPFKLIILKFLITVRKLSLFFNLTEIFVIVGMMICVYVPMMFPLVFFDKGFSFEIKF